MAVVFSEGVVFSNLYNSADVTKIITFSTSGMTTGVISTLVWSGAASVMTFPSGTSTLLTTTLAQALTNKTIDDATNVVRATKLATSGTPVTITLTAVSANQTLLTTSATAASYTTIDLAKILTIGNTTGSTDVQFTGTASLVMTTANNIITTLPTIPLVLKAANSVSGNTAGAAVNITGGTGAGSGAGGSINVLTGKVGAGGTAGSIILDVKTNGSGAGIQGALEIIGHMRLNYAGLPTITRVGGAGAISISPDSNDSSGNISAGPSTTIRVTFSTPYAGSNVRVFLTVTNDTGAGALNDKFGVINDSNTFFDFNNGTANRTIAVNYLVFER